MEKLIAAITEVEGLADALAMARQKMLDLDIQRQSVREAARAVTKQQHRNGVHRTRVWVSLPGGVPMHTSPYEALRWMDGESAKIEEESSRLRQRQKQLVSLITDKTGVPEGCSPEMLKAFLTLKDD
eukprot:jgi/Ulvmu1/3148/UM015_0188.1